MLVNATEMLLKARDGHYGVPQFNINNLEWTKAVLTACEEMKSPVILGVSEGAGKYMTGFKTVAAMVSAMVDSMGITVPVALHLDHGTYEGCKACIEAGFSSIMFDGSHYSIDENVAKTTELVALAHDHGLSIEAEVGSIGGEEDGVIGMNVGDEKDLNLKFPDNYGSADLAGQEVVFHVKLNQLKSESDSKVDDDLAKRYYNDDTATLDQLREEVRAELQAEADSQFFNAAGSELLNEVINNSEVTADPDAVDDMFNQLKSTYSSYASSYGLEFDQFLSMFLGTDEDGLRDTAENLVKQQIILNAIQAEENLSATDEQKDKLAVMNYFKNAAQMITTYGEDSANQIFDMGAVYYYLIDNSTYVEAPETEAETTEAENILEEKETAAEESESSSAVN